MTDEKTVTFRASDARLRLVKDQIRPQLDAGGKQTYTQGKVFEFSGGKLKLDATLPNGEPNPTFEEDVEWLRNHPQKDRVNVPGGFVEVGREPGRALPIEEDLLREIAASDDPEQIAVLYDQERTTHSRPAVLATAEARIEALEGKVPPPPAVPEHELGRVRLGEGKGRPERPGRQDAGDANASEGVASGQLPRPGENVDRGVQTVGSDEEQAEAREHPGPVKPADESPEDPFEDSRGEE